MPIVHLFLISLFSIFWISLSSQEINEDLEWGSPQERVGAPYEFLIQENGESLIVYYGENGIKINKIDASNNYENEYYFDLKEIRKNSEREELDIISVNGFIYCFAKSFDKPNRVFHVYMWRINLAELTMDIERENMFDIQFLENTRATRLHVQTSEDKNHFFLGYHNLEQGAEKERDYIFNFKGSVYAAEGEEKWNFSHIFNEPVDYFDRRKTYIQLSNSGFVLFAHSKQSMVYFASAHSDGLIEVDLFEEIKNSFPNCQSINNIRVLNSKSKNMACLTFSQHKDKRFVEGFVIVEFDKVGNYKIKNLFDTPENLLVDLKETKYKESSYCVRESEKDSFHLFSWTVFDFEEVDDLFFLVTEYNHNSYHGGPYGMSHVYRMGDLIVYRFDENLENLSSFHIPKYFFGDCGSGHCQGLISTGSPKGYSLVNTGDNLQLFYWNNTNNEVFTSGPKPDKRVVHHVPTSYLKEMGLYQTSLNPYDEEIEVNRLGVRYYMDYVIMPNVIGVSYDAILFNSQNESNSRIVTYPLE